MVVPMKLAIATLRIDVELDGDGFKSSDPASVNAAQSRRLKICHVGAVLRGRPSLAALLLCQRGAATEDRPYSLRSVFAKMVACPPHLQTLARCSKVRSNEHLTRNSCCWNSAIACSPIANSMTK